MAAPESERVKTGISGLDSILSGGIPRGNVIQPRPESRDRAVAFDPSTAGWRPAFL